MPGGQDKKKREKRRKGKVEGKIEHNWKEIENSGMENRKKNRG